MKIKRMKIMLTTIKLKDLLSIFKRIIFAKTRARDQYSAFKIR